MAIVAPQGQPNDPNNQNDPNAQQQPQALAGSQQSGAAPVGGRIASFSSGSAPGAQGSGRFTNLQKYMDANKGASDTLGARANNTLNRGFNQEQTKVSDANSKIAEAYGQGRNTIDTQGTQYKNQLGQIGQNLGTFQTFDNRGQFDQAGQQAQALTQDQAYGNLSQGNAVDQAALTAQQQAAANQAQGLLGTAQTNLQNIQTDQGRNNLFSQVLQPKQGYSSGQRSFDKLFLGGALGGIQQNLQGKQTLANQILKDTNLQGTNVNTLIGDEANLLKEFKAQALANQNLFNDKLDTRANIDFVRDMRTKRYNDIMSGLQSGNVSKDVADQLGLSGLDTYINNNQAAPTGQTQTQKNLVGTYNILNDDNALNKYFTQAGNAQNFQDIIGQQDFDASQALAALSGTKGRVDGVSQLGSSIAATQGKSLDSLAKDIQASDKNFKDQYAGRTFSGTGADAFQNTALIGQGRGLQSQLQLNQQIQNYVTNPTNNSGNAQIGARGVDTAGVGNALQQGANYWGTNYQGSAAAATNNTNIDDYIRNNTLAATDTGKAFDQGGSAGTYNTNAANAAARAEANNRALLNQTINTTGVKNALTINDQVDPATARFKGLL